MRNFTEYESSTRYRQAIQDRFYTLVQGRSMLQIDQILTLAENSFEEQKLDHSPLTVREIEVLTLIANGYTRKDVGSALKISANTAAKHIANIYHKLNVTTVAEATQYAIRCGLISNS